jgi:predicted DNA-binding transcriptional regulator AlpA
MANMSEPTGTMLRFDDLVRHGIVRNRTTLYRWIGALGFPRGKLIGPNTRVWSEHEINTWLESRPQEKIIT